jgi:hypothetical protein
MLQISLDANRLNESINDIGGSTKRKEIKSKRH